MSSFFRFAIPSICFLITGLVHADTFTVKDVEVQGLQRVSPDYAYSLVGITAGQTLDTESAEVSNIIRRLFNSGDFDNVEVIRNGDVLIVTVVERPSIRSIEINGNDSIPDDHLFDNLASIGLKEGSIYKRASLESIRKDLERSYLAQGRYGAGVLTEVIPQPRNQVDIEIEVREGSSVRIESVDFIGNQAFEDKELLKQMDLGASNFWSVFTGNDKYARDRLGSDIEKLRSFYLEQGYLDFDFEEVQISVTPDKEKVYLSLYLTEGQPYRVKSSRFEGTEEISQATFEEMLSYENDEVYQQSLISMAETQMLNELGNLGYYYAKVKAFPELNADNNTVDVLYRVETGNKIYVRQINFSGNADTSDEVLRREMRQLEGAPADKSAIDFSKAQLQRLSYLSNVSINTKPVPGEPDKMDLEVDVEERASGEFTANVGFSDSAGLSFGLGLSQSNFLGSGNRMSLSANRDTARTSLSLSFSNPYYLPSGVSRGWGIYYTQTNFENLSNSNIDWQLDRLGGYVNFGYNLSDYSRVTYGLGVDNSDITSGDLTAIDIHNYLEEHGDNFLNFTTDLNWRRSTLNRGFLPTDGSSISAGIELAVPGSDSPYYILQAGYDQYFELYPSWSFLLRGDTAYGNSLTDDSGLPFFKNYYAGGLGTVRGFRRSTLGPESPRTILVEQDPTNANPDPDQNNIGGNFKVNGGVDFIFPMPYMSDFDNIRTSLFWDFGNVFMLDSPTLFDNDQPNVGFDVKELRYSYGINLSAYTFVGPLTFSFGLPINPKKGDDRKFFQFSLGQTF